MHSSDETGDERKRHASNAGVSSEAETAKLPAHAFRERIRRASVAAAAHAEGDLALPASAQVAAALSPAPEQSGVHDRTGGTGAGDAEASIPEVSGAPTTSGASTGPTSSQRSQGSAMAQEHDQDRHKEPPGEPTSVATTSKAAVPRAWPFAGGPRDERRSHQLTQLGLGTPPRGTATRPAAKPDDFSSASPGHQNAAENATEAAGQAKARTERASSARERDTTPSRPVSATPSPGAYKVTPSRPFAASSPKPSKWSPTSTRPQRASLLRGEAARPGLLEAGLEAQSASEPVELGVASEDAAAQQSGRYSIREQGPQYVDATRGTAPSAQARLREAAEREVTVELPKATRAFPGEEDDTARARRYTPKQRPTVRRGGRTFDRANVTNVGHRGVSGMSGMLKDDRAEYANTSPDLGSPLNIPSRPQGLSGREIGSPVVTPDTPTQPRGRPVSDAAQAPFPAGRPLQTRAKDSPPALPGRTHEAPQGVFAPPPPQTLEPGSRALAAGERAESDGSIIIDPDMVGAFTDVTPSRVESLLPSSSYQPLPSDAAAFEHFMDEQAARGVRPNWKQQATLVIPRDSLGAPAREPVLSVRMAVWVVSALVLGAGGVLVVGELFGSPFGLTRQPGGPGQVTDRQAVSTESRDLPLSNSKESTVIASEPSGAELLIDGMIVGNTPVKVDRPQPGAGDVTCTVRMRGFMQESVRLGAKSQPAIRVTLRPDAHTP